jgi:Sugar (and other) transporter
MFYHCNNIYPFIPDENDYRIEKEIENIENTSNFGLQMDSKWEELKKPQLYKPLAMMITFFAFQQFSGIFVIFVYAAQFSKQAGVEDPLLTAVFIVS